MLRLCNLILIVRPHNVAAAVLSTAVGYSLTDSSSGPWILLAAVAVVTAAGYIINDIYDIDIDRINKPHRPLPSGALSMLRVKVLYLVLVTGAIILAFSLPIFQAVWVIVWVCLLHLYSAVFKRLYLAGNLIVSSISASGFLLGAFAGGNISVGFVPASFTFLFSMGRELVKDSEDLEGDRACGARTIPIVSGKKTALSAAIAIFIALAFGFPLPYILGYYGKTYGLIMISTVVPIMVAAIVLTARGRSLGMVSTMLKSGIFFGIIAFYFSSHT